MRSPSTFLDPSIATDVQTRYADVDDQFGPDYGRALGYGKSSNRDLDNPEDFPAGTRKVRIVFDIDRTKFWNLVVAKLTAPVRS